MNTLWHTPPPFGPTPDRILDVVAHMYGITRDDLVSRSRRHPLVRRRQIACWLMRDILELSYPQIADTVNYADHTAAMYSVQVIQRKMRGDVHLAAELQTLRNLIGQGAMAA